MAESDIEKSAAPSGSVPSSEMNKMYGEKDDSQSQLSSSTLRREVSFPADTTDIEAQEPEPATISTANGTPPKDPYEVGWDDGDNDPMNPRSMTKARKWFIVFITSFGCFAV